MPTSLATDANSLSNIDLKQRLVVVVAVIIEDHATNATRPTKRPPSGLLACPRGPPFACPIQSAMSPPAAASEIAAAASDAAYPHHPFARRSLSEPGPLGSGVAVDDDRGRAAGAARDHPPSACPFSGRTAAITTSSGSGCPFAAASSSSAAAPSTSADQQQQQQQQPWQARLRRPTTDASVARLSRRAHRLSGRAFALSEVSQHRYADDGWIAVRGRVYDITEHVLAHKGWESGCGMTEVLSILAHLGTDCTSEFEQIHACYPVAFSQLKAYDIGPLLAEEEEGGR